MPGLPRVVVDASELGHGSRLRGMGTVVWHVLAGLGRVADLEIAALARPDVVLPVGVEHLRLPRHDLRPRFARIEHDLRLPGDLRRARADLVWSPANAPPRRSPAPLVQTVHDLIPLALPHPMSARDATRWRRRADVLRSARTVVAVSRWSADQVIGLFDVDPARVEVVHNGVEAAFTPGDAPESPPYLLVVSAWGPHKGFAEAVALAGAIAEAGYPHVLRLAGVHGAWAEERLGEVVDASARPDRVEVLGWVDDLPALYRGASALLCTSRAEGFGLPALEALACGTPVVAFDNTALPEVLGDAGVLVADGDVTAMAEAVGRVLDDASLAADLRARGPARAAQFSWDATVAGYHEVLVAAANA